MRVDTTININKETANKVRKLAEREKRSISRQIDFIISKYLSEINNKN